jgi:hypothetical protein
VRRRRFAAILMPPYTGAALPRAARNSTGGRGRGTASQATAPIITVGERRTIDRPAERQKPRLLRCSKLPCRLSSHGGPPAAPRIEFGWRPEMAARVAAGRFYRVRPPTG